MTAYVNGSSAVATLRANGFRTYVFERGTIWANKGQSYYAFAHRQPGYNLEAVLRAVRDVP